MQMQRTSYIAAVGVLIGLTIVGVAKWWAAQSVQPGEVIGSNVGAGLLGLSGMAVAALSAAVWIVLFFRQK